MQGEIPGSDCTHHAERLPDHQRVADFLLQLHFGDLILSHSNGNSSRISNPLDWGFITNPLNMGLGSGQDISQLGDLSGISIPDSLPAPSMEGVQGSSTSEFESGVTSSASIDFPILKASSVINLILGKPATLAEVTLPEFGFNFFYRQTFPGLIIPGLNLERESGKVT